LLKVLLLLLLLKADEIKIRRLVFLSLIGGSGADGSVLFSVGGDGIGEEKVAGLSLLKRMGSFSVVKSALELDENELASDDVDEEMGAAWFSSNWLKVEKVGWDLS
jgi:hypothetical protein